jgi:dTDP-4-dehydrorhamnose 3,5-epimerase
MEIIDCPLSGILILKPKTYVDSRGFFLETYESARYKSIGINEEFIQDNHSRSVKNVLRGLHFTRRHPQAQILTVMRGKIFDVVVDIRKNSPTFCQWFGVELSDSGIGQIYMPHGFAHGFCVLSDFADLHYKVSAKFDPSDDGGLRWNDPMIDIAWPVKNPIVSNRDQHHPMMTEIINSKYD